MLERAEYKPYTYISKEDLMKKRVLSLFMVLVLCLTLLPTAAFAEGEDVSISGGVIGGGETGGEGGGIYVAPGSPTEGDGGTYIPGEATRTEIWFVRKPDSIGRSYDGTTDGSMVSFGTPQFTDGTNTFELTEGTDFTAKKTFDSADAGDHTVTVEITLIGNAATEYKLKSGEEKFKIRGTINKAYPELTVSLSETTCTVGEKLLPLLSISGRQENAAVTYYYTQYQTLAGASEYEGSDVIPAIDENTAINSLDEEGNNTYYLYAKTAATKNYNEGLSNVVELTVNEAVVEAASVTRADGTDGGTYESLPAALNAAQDGDTVKLLANHTTNWSDVEAGEYSTLAVVKKTLTLELNVWTVDYLVVGEVVSDEAGGILESTDGNLTVADNVQGGGYGKIKNLEFVKGSLAIQGGWIGDYDGSKLTCNGNSGSVIISGGTVYNATVGDGATVTVTGGTGHAGNWCNDGTLNITDGTFGGVKFYNNSGTIAISGGTFSTLQNFDNTSSLIAPISLLAPGHAFYKDNTVQDGSRRDFLQDVTVKEHTHTMVNNKCACGLSCTHTNAEGASTIGKDGKCTVCGTQFAAGIGETYYTDVPSALNVAADGQTVKLLANEMLPDGIYVSKTLTLDLDGHSLSGYSLNVGGLTAMSQVRTGKLTVIDSSGGNGAVGVTVREGGTLVFDPKNDHTTLLQLEVWGGTVELYGGKISRSGLRLNNGIALGNLLPGQAGLAYYRGDTQLTLEEAASQTCDLVVKSCTHGGKNGFDQNATACPDCNAPAVAETDLNDGEGGRQRRRFADLQTAIDADRDGGATLQLLADVTGDYTINGTQDTGLYLNGHCIKGTVTVKAAAGNNTTTFSNTRNTTTAGIDAVVAYKGANLAGSDYPAVIGELTLADTTQWKDILQQTTHIGFRVTNTDGTHTWYAPDDIEGSQLNNVIINYDKAAPDWSGNESGIRIKSTWWNKSLSSVTFGLYKGSSLDVYAKANDSQSGVAEYYYYIDNSGSTTTLTAEELSNKSFTKVAADKNGTTKLTEITSDNNYVIYAYAVDAAGNRSTYISSDGVVLDNTAPQLTNVSTPAKSNGTLSDTSATITFTGSEAGTYYYILKENGEPAPTVMSDFAAKTAGDKVDTWTAKEGVSTGTLTADEANTIKFTGLKAETSYVLYLAATDAAGNASVAESAGADGDSGVVSVSFTTTKTTPYVKTAPVLSGNYGDTVSAMLEKADITKASVTAGPSSDTKIEGTWTPAFEDADEIPAVGTSEKYILTFTPTGSDADTYDSVTCEVTPEVSKKQITVVISDKEKFYGEANPALTWSLATGDAYADNVLVAGDTEEALGISLSTTAKDNSNVGTYAITGLSDSANYEVSFSGSGSDGKSGVMTVKQAAKAPNMPENAMTPAHSTKKVGDITLPDGWSWQEADKDTALADGVAVTANAIYTGTDKGNYETESVSITITRSECEHTHTEIRNQREATCKEEGYTGDTYCKDCGEKLAAGTTTGKKPHTVGTPATCVSKAVCSVCGETFGEVDATNHVHTTVKNRREATCIQTGYTGDTYCTDCDKLLETGEELAALGHDYLASVTKQPTTTEEGIRTYTCTRCGHSYTESIAKLTSPSPQPTATPSDKPETPSPQPTATPSDKPETPSPQPKGTNLKDDTGAAYKVTSANGKTPAVQYIAPKSGVKGTVTVPLEVTIDGVTYKVTSIAGNAFKGTKKIKKIVIGSNITSIGKNAFAGCTSLTSITIGKNVTKIGKNAFTGCKKLKSITIKTKKLTTKTVKKGAFNGISKKVVVKVPKSKYKTYKKLLPAKGLKKAAKIKK